MLEVVLGVATFFAIVGSPASNRMRRATDFQAAAACVDSNRMLESWLEYLTGEVLGFEQCVHFCAVLKQPDTAWI